MKPLRIAALILIGLLIDTIALAVDINPRVASLITPLNLSEQQIQELNKVFTETHDKVESLRKEIREANKKKQARIDAVLTSEQKKKYEDMKNPSFPAEAEPPQMMPMGIEP
jgi:uncharacterized protein involved in exopolysaccharide biosynthesis